jgi:hypothetical protein
MFIRSLSKKYAIIGIELEQQLADTTTEQK